MDTRTTKSAGLARSAVATWREIWRMRRPEQTPLLVLGTVLVASGLFHAGVWAVDGGPLTGPVSWRKPIVFGLSGGILALSLGWLTGYLRPTRASLPMAWTYTALMGTEVFLVTMQQWRGLPSHFNTATTFDHAVFQIMGFLILLASAQIGWWTWRSFRAIDASPDMAHAIRAGLLFVNAGNLLGIAIIANAEMLAAAGATGGFNVFGSAGLMKVPHALGLHALQALPALGWLLARSGADAAARLVRMRLATAGYGALVLFAMVQTFAGRAPLDVTPATATLALAGLAALAAPFVTAVFPRNPQPVRP